MINSNFFSKKGIFKKVAVFTAIISVIVTILYANLSQVSAEGDNGNSFDFDVFMAEQYYSTVQYTPLSWDSPSKILIDEMHKNSEFMGSLTAWETLNFVGKPFSNDKITNKQQYYETIIAETLNMNLGNKENIAAVLGKSVADGEKLTDNVLKSQKLVAKYFQNSTVKQIIKSKEELDMFNADLINEANMWGDTYDSLSDISSAIGNMGNLIKFGTTTYDDIFKLEGFLIACQNAQEEQKAIIHDMYVNCTNNELRSALQKFETAMSDSVNYQDFITVYWSNNVTVNAINIVMDKFFDAVIEAVGGPVAAIYKGIKIGLAVGNTVNSFLFSTDDMIAQFYRMECMAEFEQLIKKSCKNLGTKFNSGKTNQNAKNYTYALGAIYTCTSVSADYALKFVNIQLNANASVAMSWLSGGKSDENYNALIKSITSIKNTCEQIQKIRRISALNELAGVNPEMFTELDKTLHLSNETGYRPLIGVSFPTDKVEYGTLENMTQPDASRAIANPSNATGAYFHYISDNENVLKVKDGIIIPVNAGTANLYAYSPSEIGDDNVMSLFNNPIYSRCWAKQEVTVINGYGSTNYVPVSSFRFDKTSAEFGTEDTIQLYKETGALLTTASSYAAILTPYNATSIGTGITYTSSDETIFEIEDVQIPNAIGGGFTTKTLLKFNKVGTAVLTAKINDVKTGQEYKATQTVRVVAGHGADAGITPPAPVKVGDSFTAGNLTYTVTAYGTTRTVSVKATSTNITSADIPDNVSYNGILFSVTSIDAKAFNGCNKLTTLTIGSNVINIGNHALNEAYKLTTIIFEQGTTNIPALNRVQNNSSITNVVIPEGVTSISAEAFKGLTSLSNITLPKSLKTIGNNAFSNCSSLENLTLPQSLETIGSRAFFGTAITKISLPPSIVSFAQHYNSDGTFYGSNIKEVVFEPGRTEIPYDALFTNYSNVHTTSIESVVLPSGILKIGSGAFENCVRLKSLTIPDGVEYIEKAFSGTAITKIVIPNSVISINLNGANELTDVIFKDGIVTIPSLNGGTSIKNVVIPEGVKSISNNAFNGLAGLESIILPHSLVSVGDNAFSGTAITEISLPASITSLSYAFNGALNLKKVVFENGTTRIPTRALYGTTRVTEVVIPEGVTSIGNSAFTDCLDLETINLPNTLISIGGKVFNNSGLKEINIPPNVSTFEAENDITSPGSFMGASKLTKVVFESGRTRIPTRALHSATHVTEVVIPEGVTSIGNSAFKDCLDLETINLPNTLISIGGNVFSNSGLKEINIPPNVSTFEAENDVNVSGSFMGASKLTKVIFESGRTQIPNKALFRANNVVEVVIPDSVNLIGYAAFVDCSSLKSIIIPSSVETIRDKTHTYGSTYNWGISFDSGEQLTIYGYSGTEAERFANDNNNTFVSLGDAPTRYTVTFVANGGSNVESKTVNENSTVQKPIDPTRENYTFAGWYKDENCTIVWDFDTDTVTADITLYAKWTESSGGGDGGDTPPNLNFDYTITNGLVTINKYKGGETDVVIPKLIEGKPVVAIGENAFADSENLESVTILSNVTSIAENAISDTGIKIFGYSGTVASNYASNNGNNFSSNSPTIVAFDANGDGEINNKDVTYLKRALTDWDGYSVIEAEGDVNGDGFVDGKDTTYMKRAFAEWPGYTLERTALYMEEFTIGESESTESTDDMLNESEPPDDTDDTSSEVEPSDDTDDTSSKSESSDNTGDTSSKSEPSDNTGDTSSESEPSNDSSSESETSDDTGDISSESEPSNDTSSESEPSYNTNDTPPDSND